ncbi:transposase family protein [Streptomyces sp. NPDC057375]|uniref:transposase family protein n=1 Tax=Streptomyces sp. NPDC057375 TaxID=3346109 RepID=UPI003626B2DA
MIVARTRDGTIAPCPDCDTPARRVHSRYRRRLADAALGNRPVVIDLCVRRLFCDSARCARRTFAEQTATHAARASGPSPTTPSAPPGWTPGCPT